MVNKILVFLGTRPEIIKLAPVIYELRRSNHVNLEICFTGQHIEMALSLLEFFQIKPDYELNVMKENQNLNMLSSRLFMEIDSVLEESKPNLVMLQGDTTTAMVSAIASFHRKIRIAHVEAGLRSFNKYAPFPEEVNRCIISKIADFNFAPTERARQNLLKERIPPSSIWVTGNTVVDAMQYTVEMIEKNHELKADIYNYFLIREPKLFDKGTKIVLITIHRRENIGKNMYNICNAVALLANKYENMFFVIPVHKNPEVRKIIFEVLSGIRNVILLDHLPYPHFIFLMSKSFLILTDSGGVQEEAPSFGVPVLVLREVTERIEGIETGISKLVGSDRDNVFREVSKILDYPKEHNKMANAVNPYGDGKASKRIVSILLDITK